ncbi:MAG: hypothetical protein ACON3Z_15560 [Bradymonadia bacterium]
MHRPPQTPSIKPLLALLVALCTTIGCAEHTGIYEYDCFAADNECPENFVCRVGEEGRGICFEKFDIPGRDAEVPPLNNERPSDTPIDTPGGGEVPGPGGDPGSGVSQNRCDEPGHQPWLYTISPQLEVRATNPDTKETVVLGACNLELIAQALISEHGVQHEINHRWNVGFYPFFTSFAVSSTGEAYVSFVMVYKLGDARSGFYGVVRIPDIHQIRDCTPHVLGDNRETERYSEPSRMFEERMQSFTIGLMGEGEDEALYGVLFTGRPLPDHGGRSESPYFDESNVGHELMVINRDDWSMSEAMTRDFSSRLKEISRGGNTGMMSLYTINGCTGDCRQDEEGATGERIKSFRLAEVTPGAEELGLAYPVDVQAPQNITCGPGGTQTHERNFSAHCSYNSSHNAAFIGDRAFLVYGRQSTSNGVSGWYGHVDALWTHDFDLLMTHPDSYSGRSMWGDNVTYGEVNSLLHELTFDEETRRYTANRPTELNFGIVGMDSGCGPQY